MDSENRTESLTPVALLGYALDDTVICLPIVYRDEGWSLRLLDGTHICGDRDVLENGRHDARNGLYRLEIGVPISGGHALCVGKNMLAPLADRPRQTIEDLLPHEDGTMRFQCGTADEIGALIERLHTFVLADRESLPLETAELARALKTNSLEGWARMHQFVETDQKRGWLVEDYIAIVLSREPTDELREQVVRSFKAVYIS